MAICYSSRRKLIQCSHFLLAAQPADPPIAYRVAPKAPQLLTPPHPRLSKHRLFHNSKLLLLVALSGLLSPRGCPGQLAHSLQGRPQTSSSKYISTSGSQQAWARPPASGSESAQSLSHHLGLSCVSPLALLSWPVHPQSRHHHPSPGPLCHLLTGLPGPVLPLPSITALWPRC